MKVFRDTGIKNSCLISAICLLFIIPLSTAQAGTAKDKLLAFYNDVKSMRATFTQTTLDSRFMVASESAGTLIMQRPGKFRWDYSSPYEQVIVADGVKLWIYDTDLEQITVKKLDDVLGNSPALLLSGSGSLEKNFKIIEMQLKVDGLDWIELFPKEEDASFTSVRLAFGKKGLSRMELVDGFGQTTRMLFTDVQNNPKIDAAIFNFKPPKGVDVIGEE